MSETNNPREFENALLEALGEGKIICGSAVSADYTHDELPNGAPYAPVAVCLAKTAEDVSTVLKLCNEYSMPVTPRGAGTGLVGGSVPVKGGVVLALGGMNEILGYDEENMTVRIQPGVLLSELKDDVAARGFLYAPDPGEKTSTVGGNAATNAGGPCAIRYGTTRDNVISAIVALPTGELLYLGGNVGKSSSGYNLLQLVLGSEGTLGVITELTLKLHPKPLADVGFILPFAETENIPAVAAEIKRSGLVVQSMEYIDTDMVEFAGAVTGNPVFPLVMDGDRVAASMLVTFEGKDDDELDKIMESVAEMSEEWGVMDILVVDTPTLKREVWVAYDAFHSAPEKAAAYGDELNSVVPPMKMMEYFNYVKALGSEVGLSIYAYGHAGDGGVHISVCANEGTAEQFAEKKTALFSAAYAKCTELGGKVSSEHGIGYAKQEYLKESMGEVGYALMGRIKAAFDPNGIMNPGKVCD